MLRCFTQTINNNTPNSNKLLFF